MTLSINHSVTVDYMNININIYVGRSEVYHINISMDEIYQQIKSRLESDAKIQPALVILQPHKYKGVPF